MYLYYYIFRQRSSLPLPVYICPYHTKMNKSLVLEWPTFTDVYSFNCLLQQDEYEMVMKQRGGTKQNQEGMPNVFQSTFSQSEMK